MVPTGPTVQSQVSGRRVASGSWAHGSVRGPAGPHSELGESSGPAGHLGEKVAPLPIVYLPWPRGWLIKVRACLLLAPSESVALTSVLCSQNGLKFHRHTMRCCFLRHKNTKNTLPTNNQKNRMRRLLILSHVGKYYSIQCCLFVCLFSRSFVRLHT